MRVPEFWRAPDNKLYRIRRERRPMKDTLGFVYTVRAFPPSNPTSVAAEASVVQREADLLEMVRMKQKVPTPEQLYLEALQQVMKRLCP